MKTSTIENYSIINKESLDLLLKKKNKRYGKFTIQVDNMDERKAHKFENELNKYYASCGCTVGNYFLISTLLFGIAYFFITRQPINNWKIIIQGFFILFIAAIIGKFIGKLIASFKFKKTIKKLRHELL